MKFSLTILYYKILNRFDLQFIKHSLQDMRREKAKVIFGVSGIAISLFLLTSIGMFNDTMSYNYIRLVTLTTGEADIVITKTVETDLNFDPFFDENIIDDDLEDIKGVEEFFTRIMILAKVSSEYVDKNMSLEVYGMDFEAEAENGNMGDLVVIDDDGNETDEIIESKLGFGECILLEKAAELLEVDEGDTIHMEYLDYTLDVVVSEICIQDLKFMHFETALVLLDLEEVQSFINREGQINYIMGTIENREVVYNARNIDETTLRLRKIGSDIQERLDINQFEVTLPKLEELEAREFNLLSITILFWFITLLSMLITGILINSILSTSIEERIREFGIIRVVGGKKDFPVKMVIFEGLLLGLIGSLIGVIIGMAFAEPLAIMLFASVDSDVSQMVFVIQPSTILIAFSIGIVIPVIVSILPAIKVGKMDLIKSITPFQPKEEGWEISKEESANVKSLIIGLSIASMGMLMFILLPRVIITGEFMLIASLFIGLLAAILLGMVLVSIAIIPYLQKLMLGIISPAIKRYASIIRISLNRYRRRNTGTIIMFAISFSFIFFNTSLSEMQSENTAMALRFQYGSDLVIVNQGLNEDDAVTLEMVEALRTIKGVDKVAYTLHNTFDYQAIISVVIETSGGGDLQQSSSAEQNIRDLFEYYTTVQNRKFKVTAGDISGHDEMVCGFIGIDEDFVELIDKDLLIWESPEDDPDYSFDKMFDKNNTVIIAQSIASILGVEDVGEEIRLVFYDPSIENDPGKAMLFTIAGISGGIPGFWNFRSSETSAYGGGVMVSLENYMRLMDVENPEEPNMIVDKVFINLRDNSEESIEETKEDIRNLFQDSNFIIDDAISKINYIEEANERQSLIMEIILGFTIVICIFGLVSTMYAILLERKFEIGILRAIGLKAKNVRNMFLIESLLIMLSAGLMGMAIGTYTAYLLQSNTALFSEMPLVFVFPLETFLRVFIISITVSIVGTYLILLKLSKQTVMDVFRQSF